MHAAAAVACLYRPTCQYSCTIIITLRPAAAARDRKPNRSLVGHISVHSGLRRTVRSSRRSLPVDTAAVYATHSQIRWTHAWPGTRRHSRHCKTQDSLTLRSCRFTRSYRIVNLHSGKASSTNMTPSAGRHERHVKIFHSKISPLRQPT